MSNYSYEPHDWANEELITEENVDHIENGIANAYSWLGELEDELSTVGTFEATYDTTPFNEVYSAYTAGNAVYCKREGVIAPLTGTFTGCLIFSCDTDDGNYTFYLRNLDGWSYDHSYNVPSSRTINNKTLSADITLTASDVGAAVTNHNHDSAYAAINHNHDSTYTTPAQVDQKIADALASIPVADNIVYSAI